MCQGEPFGQYEMDGLATLRIAREGTRIIACCSHASMCNFIRKEEDMTARYSPSISGERAATALRTITKEQLEHTQIFKHVEQYYGRAALHQRFRDTWLETSSTALCGPLRHHGELLSQERCSSLPLSTAVSLYV